MAADIIGVWADWNAISLWKPDPFDHQDVYLRVIDRSGTAIVGKNNIITTPQFIDPDNGNYLLRSSDPLASAGHDGGHVGARLGAKLPAAADTAKIIPGIPGAELLLNGGAEEGIPDPWWMHSGGGSQAVQINVMNETEFGGQTVRPHSGSNFFLLNGVVTCTDGSGMASAYQEWRPLQADWDEVDAGSAIFKLDGYYWSENQVSPPGIAPSVEFFDDSSNVLHVAYGEGLEYWATPSGYNRLTFYGQVPPLARQANVLIMANFIGYDGEYDFALAFDDVSLTILTNTTVDIMETGSEAPQIFALYQNYPNPFNPETTIRYQLSKAGQVNLAIYNLIGQKVAILNNKKQHAGSHKVEWDASGFSSGVYFYRLETFEFPSRCVINLGRNSRNSCPEHLILDWNKYV